MFILSAAHAASLYVGPGLPYADIPSAVADAAPGDTLRLLPGTHLLDTTSITQDLTIEGIGGHGATTVLVEGYEDGLVVSGATLTLRQLHFEMDGFNRALRTEPGSTLLVEHSVFTGGGMDEGACLLLEGEASVWSSRFETCASFGFLTVPAGGAIHHEGTELLLDGVTFVDNEAGMGGAVYCGTGSCSMSASLLQGNQATTGGAVYAAAPVDVWGTRFCDNGADQGGAIAVRDEPLTLRASVLWSNDAGSGGAVHVAQDPASVHELTSEHVLWGYGTGSATGVQGGDADTYRFTNDLFVHVPGVFAADGAAGVNSWVVDHALVFDVGTLVPGSATVTNRIDADPLLADADPLACEASAFVLSPASPAVGAGTDGDLGPMGGVDPWRDVDGDGVFAPEDCDDTDPTVFPGAPEACNGVDDDCDGLVDEELQTTDAWVDADGDGVGGGPAIPLCAPPDELVLVDGDCDDTDPTVFPGATEACDGVDENCDGVIDDGHGTSAFFFDNDGDGYGTGAAVAACAAPPGHVPFGGDCDDIRDAVFPGATETCNGVDDDCDGEQDEDAADGIEAFADADLDGWGDEALGRRCVLEEGEVDVAGDCDDADDTVFPGASELCDGVDQDCDGEVDERAVDAEVLYVDADGDGYGAGDGEQSCGDAGLVDNDLDCDDADAQVNPDASEIPGNGIDDDCLDGDEPLPGTTTTTTTDTTTPTEPSPDPDDDKDSGCQSAPTVVPAWWRRR